MRTKLFLLFFIFGLTGCVGGISSLPAEAGNTPVSHETPSEMTIRNEMQDGIEQGNRIIEALDLYYRANAASPLGLNELVPTYLDEIPQTITGQAYRYELLEPDSVRGQPFLLIFYPILEKNVSCSYMQRFDDWDCSMSVKD